MNSWKLNRRIGHLARVAIIKGLEISSDDIYRAVKNINPNNGIIEAKDGKTYKLTLQEIQKI